MSSKKLTTLLSYRALASTVLLDYHQAVLVQCIKRGKALKMNVNSAHMLYFCLQFAGATKKLKFTIVNKVEIFLTQNSLCITSQICVLRGN